MELFKKYVKVEEEKYLDLLDKNEKLKELCDKYEEEHNNEFQCWKKDRRELLDKRQIIERAIEYIENDMPYLEEPDEEFERSDGTTYMTMKEYDASDLLKILKGEEL